MVIRIIDTKFEPYNGLIMSANDMYAFSFTLPTTAKIKSIAFTAQSIFNTNYVLQINGDFLTDPDGDPFERSNQNTLIKYPVTSQGNGIYNIQFMVPKNSKPLVLRNIRVEAEV